ncbi:flagellar protein FlaG [Azonexus sp. IMCC34839]|uniref:flagellar protein FlaG n=1 Tax=Azonexus sp. IMCC34839 TaxID=3133695 RepID=UPI003999F0AB
MMPIPSINGDVSPLQSRGEKLLPNPSASQVVSNSMSTTPQTEVGSLQQVGTAAESLRNATERINAFVQPVSSDITFSIDEETGSTVVKVIDRETKDILRQIPSEEILSIAKALDRLQGLLIRQKA